MLSYPTATSRKEKLAMIHTIKERLLAAHDDKILAIGAYGSIGLETDGPYSDIEMHAVTKDGVQLASYEFIYGKFKIEINSIQKSGLIEQAKKVDDGWAISAGVFINVLSVYDPDNLFEKIKALPLQISDVSVKETMREFMIWEPYETIAKIRNNYAIMNLDYLPFGAHDLTWQTAKLIGLANKEYFSTRARTFEESLKMESKPDGYEEIAVCVMKGKLDDSEYIYRLCENLWTGLNEWYEKLDINYKITHFPF